MIKNVPPNSNVVPGFNDTSSLISNSSTLKSGTEGSHNVLVVDVVPMVGPSADNHPTRSLCWWTTNGLLSHYGLFSEILTGEDKRNLQIRVDEGDLPLGR